MFNFLKSIKFELKYWLTNWFVSYIPWMAFRLFWYRKLMGMTIGKYSQIWIGCKFYGDSLRKIYIGDHSTLAFNVTLNASDSIYIGDNVSLASGVVILTADHDYDSPELDVRTGIVYIHDDVHVLTNSIILKGSRLGNGTVVGAGSVVSGVIPEYSIVMGNPARVIGKRKKFEFYNFSPGALIYFDPKCYRDYLNL